MAANTAQPAVNQSAPHLRRVLGTWDLTWLCVVAITNMNLVPVVAAGGFTTIWLWLLALGFFFWPQGIAVIASDEALRFQLEAGLPLGQGDVWGFSWLHVRLVLLAHAVFVPTLLFYLAGIWAFAGGKNAAALSENRLFFFFVSLALLWLTVVLNIRGMGVGKWVNNLGGMGTFVTAVVLIGLGIFTALRQGIHIPDGSFSIGDLDWRLVSSFGVICFGLVGLERDGDGRREIRDPSAPCRVPCFGAACSREPFMSAQRCACCWRSRRRT
jgi:amino acid transporter